MYMLKFADFWEPNNVYVDIRKNIPDMHGNI